jgi:uncharacterized membrane protein
MSNVKFNMRTIFLLIAFWIGCALLYPKLPTQVPIHWNIHGEVDGYAHKAMTAFIMPLLPLFIYVLMTATAKIDPRHKNYEKFVGSYVKIRMALVLMMVGIVLLTEVSALGYEVNIDLIIRIMLPILFIYLGNFMGKIRHNYFIGIRTPWTLANEEVWVKTHRLGSKLMVAGSVIALAGAFFTPTVGFIILMSGVLFPVLISTVYSYLLFSQLVKR